MTDTIAMIAAANTTLQNPNKVGNGLKSIATNLAGIKASAKDGSLELNKTAKTLKEVAGIDIFADKKKGEIKDMAVLVEELASKWDSFNDMDKAGISESIAGKQQAAVFQSLMSNMQVMKDVQSELNQGWHFGSALAENEQYVDSLSGKLNKLKETWVGIFQTVFDSNAAKGIVDVFISISEAISKVVTALDEVGMLTPVLTALMVGAGAKLLGFGKNTTGVFKATTQAMMGTATAAPIVTRGFLGIGRTAATVTTGVEGAAIAASTGAVTMGTLGTALLGVAAAGVAIGGTLWIYDQLTESLDEEAQRLNESVDARKKEISQIEEQKSALSGIADEYDKLSNKPKKTAEEVARLNELTKELAQIRPDLVVGYDENNNPIIAMNGDVKDLISEMERGIDTKKKLLSFEQSDLKDNSIKQLHGDKDKMYNSKSAGEYKQTTEMTKLEDAATRHSEKMSKLEKKRNKAVDSLLGASEKDKRKTLSEIKKIDHEMMKEQERFSQEYSQQMDVIKEYSNKIGEGFFSELEFSNSFKGLSDEAQNQVRAFKDVLDFSDIDTDVEIMAVEQALRAMTKAIGDGDLDIAKLSDSIKKANDEFAKTQDLDQYERSIDGIIKQLKEIPGLEDLNFDVVKDMFMGLDSSAMKGNDALDKFMKNYSKSASDLSKDDSFAKALADQYRTIENTLNDLESIGQDKEFDLKLAYDLSTDQDLPADVSNMINVLLNKGHDPTKVLEVTQQIMFDLQNGEINVDEWNELIQESFGEGSYEINPELLLSPNARVEGVETVVKQLTDKFGEVPSVVKTIIEADATPSYAEGKAVMEMYDAFPDEVKTQISTNGYESLEQLQLIESLLSVLPPEVVTNIMTNFPEVVGNSQDLREAIYNLPTNTLLEIQSNYPEAVEKSALLKEAIDNIPDVKKSSVEVDDSQAQSKFSASGFLGKLFGKDKKEETTTVTVNAEVNGEEQVENLGNMINGLTGGGYKGSSSSFMGRSIEANVLNEDIPSTFASGKGSSGGSSGGGHTVVVNVVTEGLDQIVSLKDELNTIKAVNLVVNTSTAAKNISGLIVRVKEYKAATSSIKSIVFKSETAQSAKNISGLLNRVKEYQTAASSIKTLVFKSETAQAAKNISGLISKVGEYNKVNPKTLTFKTNASTITGQVNSLANAVRNVPNGKTITYNIKQNGSVPKAPKSMPTPQSTEPMLVNETDISTLDNQLTTPQTRGWGNPLETHKFNLNHYIELENQLKKIASQLDIIDEKAKNAFGQEKINYLRQQEDLLKKQQQLQSQMASEMQKQQQALKNFLGGKGISFDSDGNISNYHTKLVAMNKELERLEEASKKASEASSNYKGDNEGEKDRLSNAAKSASEALSKYKDNYDELKKAMDEYLSLTFDDIPKAKEEWEKLQSEIKETSDALEELNRNQRLFEHQNKVKELDYEYDKLADKLDLIDEKLKHAYGTDKLKLIEEQISLMKQQQGIQNQLVESLKQQANVYRNDLSNFGFQFDGNGDITNLDETLNKFKDHKDLEKVKKLLDEYIKIQRDELPDAVKEWEKLESAIKDLYKEQLNITKQIEDEITKAYKEQVEKRKKLIDEELNKRLDALEKKKKAYQDYRDEVDYQNDYEDQLNKINDLQAEYDKLSGDNSKGAKKKLEEILKQIEEEQKKLEQLVQDKIDKDISDMFEDESNRLEEEAEKQKDQLDEDFSDEKIQELVKKALSTGVFEDIDGVMRSLQDVMLEFVDEYGDGLSVIGDLIKNEMIANLAIAKDTMKDLASIVKDLDIKQYSSSIGRMSMPNTPNMSGYSVSSNSNQIIQFNSPLINIEGNVDKGVMNDLKSLENVLVDKVCKEMMSKVNGR